MRKLRFSHRTQRLLRSSVAAVSSLCLVSTVAAAGLAPSKASQLADLTTSFATPCPLLFSDPDVYLVDVVNKPDGTTAPFVIPANQVFVVTAVQMVGAFIGANHTYFLTLFRVNGGAIGGFIVNRGGVAPVAGRVDTHVTIPNGSVVKSGTPLCVSAIDAQGGGSVNPEVVVHGFFAKDK